jgi:hypothetical protein
VLSASKSAIIRAVVGTTAIVAPLLHSVTDVMEWHQHGFSAPQLWLNYIAFLPMPWLLLGIWVVQDRIVGALGLAGALLYGIAFTYFAHSTLYALATQSGDYEALWRQLGSTYTFHGALMVVGGLLFTRAALRAGGLPRLALLLFGVGLIANFALALLPSPDILQTLGTAIRNAGLVGLGYAILRSGRDAAA